MSCGHCQSDAVVIDDVIEGVPIPRCYICGWRLLIPEAPPILESDKAKRALPLTQWSKQQYAHGLCGNCDEAALPGSRYCADHLEFHKNTCTKMQQKGAA